jgi:hypothetical protein
MKKSIYNIEQEYLVLAEQIQEAEGELTPEIEDALAINQDELTRKAVNYALVIKDLSAQSDQIKAEIDRLNKIKKSTDNAAQRLRDTVSDAMKLYGIEKVEGEFLTLSFRKSQSLGVAPDIDLEEVLKNDPSIVKETRSLALDKAEITRRIKSGINIVGFELVDNQNLQIK